MSTNDFAAFAALDLAPIKLKLMHVESGEGWTTLRADAVETEYRRFLFLMQKYPDADASPTVDVDTFWHYHILDTQKYARDCEALFGYFLHHYPYVGIGADAGSDAHAASGERMRVIYETEFGIAQSANAAHAFCTSPGQPVGAANDAHAFCTSPGKPGEAANDAHAFCTSPGKPRTEVNAAYAFCTSPGRPTAAARAVHAFRTSPGKSGQATHAFCTSPGKPTDAANAAYAFCTAPGKPQAAANAAFAFCTSPGRPAAATAFCTSPGKQAQGERMRYRAVEQARAA